ncbi:MAG: BMP family ABC transporter substrate-binding protein [Wujia sp.]
MSYADYEKAQKAGLKAFKSAVSKGENEYLPVLDEILEDVEIQSEVNLGLVQVPLDRVIGTSNVGRTYAFANNFMPILDYKTEFGAKWSNLCDSHIEEGIREPIKAYEYMNYFYVIEGNKRVSVLKYFDAVSVPAQVIRKVPKLTDDPKVRIYYEFMEFYKLTEINYIWFSQEGCFKRLLELTSEDPTAEWTDDQKKDFGSANHNFCVALKACGGDKLPMTSGDAFLIFIDIYGYDNIKNLLKNEMQEKISHLWDEFLMETKGKDVQLRMEPAKNGRKKLMDYFWSPNPKKLMVAFIFDKDPDTSDWLYGHELGRLYLDEHYGDRVKTIKVHNLNSEEDTITAMEDLVKMGVNVMFTTSSKQINSSLKIAANYPDVKVLNCSINTSHKLITTYYARLYEVKFLAGMIAGALTDNNKIGYMTDYPIIGTLANINAFALGARMVNPYAKVVLKWSTIKGVSRSDVMKSFSDEDVHYVSDQITIKPKEANRQYGLYYIDDKSTENIALPMYNWGVLYGKLIESMLDGTFKQEVSSSIQPINYWWGLSAGVVDIICSKKLPEGTKRLVDTIRDLIAGGSFLPFSGIIKAQDGTVKNEEGNSLSPEEIIKMNWLAENVEGDIPEIEELKDEAKSIVEIKGVTDEATVTG